MEDILNPKSQSRKQKAVLYLRVSTEEQIDNYSLATQEEVCKREAERRGLEVLQSFREEGRSAKTIKGRPTLIEMLEFCRKNKRDVSAVIVYRLDRISRQTEDYLAIRKKLVECEIILVSATEPTGDKPAEKFIETMLAGFAQMDNDVRGERAKSGMRARFNAGLFNGCAPLGYISKDGFAVKNTPTFEKLQKGWELLLTGTKSLRDIAEILNAQGVRDQRTGHKEYPLRSQTLSGIFRNKFYAGKVVSKKYGLEVQGQHAPMVTEEQFYAAQAIIDGRNRHLASNSLIRRNRNNPEFPLRRIVKCSLCGSSFTGAWSQGKKEKYAYYFCRKRCPGGSSVPLKIIVDTTNALLASMSLTANTIQLFNTFLRKTYHQRLSSLQRKRDQADGALKKLYEFRQALIEKNLNGTYSDAMFKEQNLLLEDKVKLIQTTKNDAVIEKYNLGAITKFVKDKLENIPKTYDGSKLEQKRVLLCSIFPVGLRWGYPGYTNTQISPFHQAILDLQKNNALAGAPGGI